MHLKITPEGGQTQRETKKSDRKLIHKHYRSIYTQTPSPSTKSPSHGVRILPNDSAPMNRSHCANAGSSTNLPIIPLWLPHERRQITHYTWERPCRRIRPWRSKARGNRLRSRKSEIRRRPRASDIYLRENPRQASMCLANVQSVLVIGTSPDIEHGAQPRAKKPGAIQWPVFIAHAALTWHPRSGQLVLFLPLDV